VPLPTQGHSTHARAACPPARPPASFRLRMCSLGILGECSPRRRVRTRVWESLCVKYRVCVSVCVRASARTPYLRRHGTESLRSRTVPARLATRSARTESLRYSAGTAAPAVLYAVGRQARLAPIHFRPPGGTVPYGSRSNTSDAFPALPSGRVVASVTSVSASSSGHAKRNSPAMASPAHPGTS
jgi:hypothetical protein